MIRLILPLHPQFIREFEDDAKVQGIFHQRMAYFWLINIPIIAFMFFALPDVWNRYGLFYTLICSLYANFATDYGALSAAQASQKADSISSDTKDAVDDVQDSLDDVTDSLGIEQAPDLDC